jgi:hypothetical protein
MEAFRCLKEKSAIYHQDLLDNYHLGLKAICIVKITLKLTLEPQLILVGSDFKQGIKLASKKDPKR